jgi:hypothetical protein
MIGLVSLLAVVLLVSATGLPAAPPGASTARPPPAVVLAGEAAAVSAIRGELGRRSVPVAEGEAPTALHARVDTTPAGLTLSIRDPDGRFAQRVVASAAGAAAVIESWRETEAEVGRPEPALPVVAAEAAPPAPARWPRLALAAETALGSDRSLWLGGSVGGCVPVGRLCLGLLLRLEGDRGAGAGRARYEDDHPADLRRVSTHALVGAEGPLRRGRWELTPGLAAGGRWMHARATYEEHDGEVSTVAVAFEARATLTLLLGHGLGLDLRAAATLSPSAHRSPFDDDDFTIPGEPVALWHAGLGLRYGPP